MLTQLYSAEFGRAGGASVNLITKSGTNQFHGGLYEFFRNEDMNANDFFLKTSELQNGQSNRPPILRQNQFGGTVGGVFEETRLSSSCRIKGHDSSMERHRD